VEQVLLVNLQGRVQRTELVRTRGAIVSRALASLRVASLGLEGVGIEIRRNEMKRVCGSAKLEEGFSRPGSPFGHDLGQTSWHWRPDVLGLSGLNGDGPPLGGSDGKA
jgi:hypothetical protein